MRFDTIFVPAFVACMALCVHSAPVPIAAPALADHEASSQPIARWAEHIPVIRQVDHEAAAEPIARGLPSSASSLPPSSSSSASSSTSSPSPNTPSSDSPASDSSSSASDSSPQFPSSSPRTRRKPTMAEVFRELSSHIFVREPEPQCKRFFCM